MNALDLAGRVALVTGGGAGIGRVLALALAGSGAAVCVNDVNPTRADAVATEILAAGGQALGWGGDIANKFQVGAMIERLRDEFGGLHIVINAWSVNKRQPFLALDEYDWRRVIEVNLTGAFLVSQLAARVMADEGGGVVLVLGSEGQAVPEHAPFVASEHGRVGLVAAMQTELSELGVRVGHIMVGDDEVAGVRRVVAALAERL